MGIFKKAVQKIKAKRAEKKENRKHRKNAGDRHHSRKRARQERRDKVRADRQERKLARMALRREGKGARFGEIMEKVGAVASQFIGRKNDDGSMEDGFVNADGTVTSAATGYPMTMSANDQVYISKQAADVAAGAGVDVFDHTDFIDEDNDGFDDRSGESKDSFNQRMPNNVIPMQAKTSDVVAKPDTKSALTRQGGETRWQWLVRVVKEKPLIAIPVLVVSVGALVFALVRWVFKPLVAFIKGRSKSKFSFQKK